MKHHRIAIIGAGPAGMSCAIQLKRMGLDPVVFERPEPSSMLRMANKVENYLGFPQGVRGEELFRLFFEQMERFQIDVLYKEVKKASFREDVFILDNEDESFSCDILVVASGTRPVRTVVPSWNENLERYLHYDISRIPRQENLEVGIIGLGDAAFDYAMNMHQRGHHVQIFGRSDKVLANKALWDQYRHAGGLPVHFSHVLISLEESMDRVRCRFRNEEQMVEHILDCLIFATGREASLEFLDEDILEQADQLNQMKRLYLAGDVKNGDFRQTAIATGDGIRIAMEIAKNEGNTENGT